MHFNTVIQYIVFSVLVLVLRLLLLLLVPASQIFPEASHWIMVLKHELHLNDIVKFCSHLQEKHMSILPRTE